MSASAAAAAASAAAASDPAPISDKELEALWSSVTGESHDSEERTSSAMLGLRPGQASFNIPELQEYKRGRVLPENGTYVEPGEDPTEGGRFGPEYRQEIQTRQQILERNPDYTFVLLLAGMTNAPVERLYDDDSLDRAFRMRLAESQTQLRVQEVQQTRSDLQEVLAREQVFQTSALALRGRLDERRRSDSILSLLPAHIQAVQNYIRQQDDNFYRVAVGSVLELGVGQLASIPVKEDEVLERAVVQLLGGSDSVEDEPDIGISVQVTTEVFIRFAFGDSRTGRMRLPQIVNSETVRAALIKAYRLSYPDKTPLFYDGRTSLEDVTREPNAPMFFREAIQRLLSLYILAREQQSIGDVERMLTSMMAGFSSNPDGAAQLAIGTTLRDLLPRARTSTRSQALSSWIDELRNLVAVLSTAHDLHDAESQMAAPTSAEQPVRTITAIAASARLDAIERARLAGASDVAAEALGRAEVEKILANPPNHLFAIPLVQRDASRTSVVRAQQKLAAIDTTGDVFDILRLFGILSAPGLAADLSLMANLTVAQRGQIGVEDGEEQVWKDAMMWYEQLGGSLFVDRDAWTIDDDDGAIAVSSGVQFPVSSDTRNADAMPLWGPGISPPPALSSQARALWNQHIPVFRTARAKIAAVSARIATVENGATSAAAAAAAGRRGILPAELSPDTALPSLTTNEVLVFRTMTGGYDPEDAEKVPFVFPKTQWPVFVFTARLLETELAFADSAIQQTITSRESLLESIRQRIQGILRGIPQPAAIVEPPYQHRRGYVEQPINSGIVSLKPIVVSAISASWGQIQRNAPHIAQSVNNDVQVLQHTPAVSTDFAELVAVNMSLYAQRFPTRYKQLGERTFSAIDMFNIINRFKHNIRITGVVQPSRNVGAGAGAGATQTPVAQVQLRPISAPVRVQRNSGPLFL